MGSYVLGRNQQTAKQVAVNQSLSPPSKPDVAK